MVYDTLLTSNPSMPGPISQVFDWMTIDHSAVNTGPMSTITFTLRSDLKWHDGTAVTSTTPTTETTAAAGRYCSNCGKPNADGAKFCMSCGTPLAA